MHQQHSLNSKMRLSRGKNPVDRNSSVSHDLERCSLNTRTEANSAIIQKLEGENAKLKMQYEDLRCQYVQLLQEAKEEKFEERRVNLLKAQVMQLERQVVLLSEGLSSQLCRSQDVEKALDPLTLRLRSLLSVESTGADVTIGRTELTQLIERCEDVKQKLHRNNKVTSPEDLAMPWLLSGSKLTKQPITLLDLCYGKTNNLNLQQVSSLESNLSQLFKHLHGTRQTLSLILAPQQEPPSTALPSAPTAVYARLLNQAHRCCAILDQCCSDLLTLSLIVPSAPWTGPKQRVIPELEVENILAALPAFPRGAPLQRARRTAQALSRASNYSLLMLQQQVEALEAELEFHRSLYSLQVQTIEQLFQGIRQAYQAFQENIYQSLCAPLQDVLSCYEDLRRTASEPALHRFLSAFKRNLAQIQEAVEAFCPSKSAGDEALAQYGREFLQAVEKLLQECAEERENASGQLHVLQREQQQALQTLHTLQAQRKKEASEGDQIPTTCAQRTTRECLAEPEQSEGAGKSDGGAAKEPSIESAEQGNNGIQRTRSADSSMNSSSQLTGVNQRLGKAHEGQKKRSSFRSKSRKVEARPEWQT
ncbi:uncharacterized protein LOC134335417 isoform X1 [Trichomycterus rosablanca]|uniref:uncharacterized protein LOC134335417 isoform X1 n=1 Tax=Trichomycterus rosablanca TaxID=2290929 RepID=UPI002F3575C6